VGDLYCRTAIRLPCLLIALQRVLRHVFVGTHRYDFEETRRGALVFIWVGLAMGAAQFVSVCLFEFTAERQVRSIHPGLPCPHLRPDFFAQSGHDGNLTDTQGYSRVLAGARGCNSAGQRRWSVESSADRPCRFAARHAASACIRTRAPCNGVATSRITTGCQPTFALVPGHAVPARVHQVRAGAGRSSRAPACAVPCRFSGAALGGVGAR
jgi:hypothetical protein